MLRLPTKGSSSPRPRHREPFPTGSVVLQSDNPKNYAMDTKKPPGKSRRLSANPLIKKSGTATPTPFPFRERFTKSLMFQFMFQYMSWKDLLLFTVYHEYPMKSRIFFSLSEIFRKSLTWRFLCVKLYIEISVMRHQRIRRFGKPKPWTIRETKTEKIQTPR